MLPHFDEPARRPTARGGQSPIDIAERFDHAGAAWLGLVPRQHSTGGKTRLGRITKAGNREIRRLLVLGATAMVSRAGQWNSATGKWTRKILERRPFRLATVALSNKMARIAWALMTGNEVYQAKGHAVAVTA